MKKRLPEFFLAFSVILVLITISQTNFPLNDKTHLKPYEEMFLMRNYPDFTANSKTYLKEMQLASKQISKSFKSTGNNPTWITQGPYNTGGRINTIAVNPNDNNIIYVGTVCGGIFKTIDGGENWFPTFDENAYLSIAHIVIDPHNSNTIYVGTGDPNVSGYPFIGNGIYRSTDAGSTWEHLGLDNVGVVAKIAVNTKNPSIIYAATMGIPFERDQNRGLYKSTDNGQSWENILYLSDDAGIIDLVMLPNRPDTIFVAGWNRIRNYFESEISGSQCKIYRTFDGGTNWETLSTDLPSEDMSRIGLYLSEQDEPAIIAQFIEPNDFETEGIYKSSDFGESWDKLSANGIQDGILGGFGWYFGKIRVNPDNKNQLFILGVDLYRSDDGGQNFSITTPPWYEYSVHADKHDLVFVDSSTIILATDSGLYKSTDGGHNWVDFDNIPNTQFYRVTVDPHNIGYYAGGAQDNGTNYGSLADSNNWEHRFGGDGFQPLFDPNDANLMYCETQNGGLYYGYKQSDYYDFYNFTSGIESSDRRSWDMPISMSAINSKLLYTGTYRIYQNTNAPAAEWQAISDDLTDGTDNKYHIISALDPSPINEGWLMAGTSDSKVHIFNNNTWTDISSGLPNRYVTCVRMSANNENNLFVSHSGYKANEFIPHIHFSNDLGQNWSDISSNLPQLAINSIHVLKGYGDSVIFVASDGGIYHTLNQGETWDRTGDGMPIFPVYDLAYDDTNHTLVAGTFSRSMMTLALESIIKKYNSPSNIQENKLLFGLYPNPATEWIELSINELPKNSMCAIFDLSGKNIKTIPLEYQSIHINISDLNPGTYIVKIYNQYSTISSKIFIKN
ncbi:MAG: T9SS type A sorting domain-containing protein [Salinivirgaceae bacterium]|nr:T9SS type A sorting domain-containing protein [Salinivirgaceae bacterium]